MKAIIFRLTVILPLGLAFYSYPVSAQINVVLEANGICHLQNKHIEGEASTLNCPAGYSKSTSGTTEDLSGTCTKVFQSDQDFSGMDACPGTQQELEALVGLDAIRDEVEMDCDAHEDQDLFGFAWNLNETPDEVIVQTLVCTEQSVEPHFGEWKDSRIVQACNASCIQRVEQVRQCIGGDTCSGPSTRIVERPCSPGIGMCPITSLTRGAIINNPLIKLGTYEYSTGLAIENLCPQLGFGSSQATLAKSGGASFRREPLTSSQQDLLARCEDLILEQNDRTQLIGVQNVAPNEFASINIVATQTGLAILDNIASRLAAFRPALLRTSQDLSFNSNPSHPLPELAGKSPLNERGGAAGDDEIPEDAGRVGVYVGGLRSKAAKDETGSSSGFDNQSSIYTLGADYLLNPSTVIGIALGYGSGDNEFSSDGGSLSADTTVLSFYGTKLINDNLFLDGVIGFGDSDYDSKRNMTYTANANRVVQTAIAEPQSDQIFLSLGLGKFWSRSFDIDFTGRINYINVVVDRFAENIVGGSAPGFGLALEIEEQDIKSTTSDFNLRVSKAFSTSFGVVVPQGSLSWLHEFEDGADNLTARFLNDPFSIDFSQSGLSVAGGGGPTIFAVPLDRNDSDYGRIGLGVNILFPQSVSLYFNVNSTLGLQNIDHEYYSIGLRKDL